MADASASIENCAAILYPTSPLLSAADTAYVLMAPLTLDASAGPDRLWPLALRLLLLGFLVNCKPSEPFLTQYLLTNKHISSDDLEAHVYPWSTIGSFLLLLPAGLAAEHFGSRRVIFCGLLCREATRVLLILGEGVPAMAAMQLSYAGAVAVDAIYFAHIFAAAPPSAYAALTSIVYAAYHGGNVLGSLLGQGALALWPALAADLRPLFIASCATTTLGLGAFFLLPPPRRAPPPSLASVLRGEGARGAWAALSGLWATASSRRWLAWWVCASAGATLVGNYFQLQLAAVSVETPFGLLEAGMEVGLAVGAAAARCLGGRAGRPAFLVVTSALMGALYVGCALFAEAGSLWAPFALNVGAAALYALQLAAGSARLAAGLRSARYALLFSCNTLAGLAAAALAQAVGAGVGLGANGYYLVAAAAQVAVAAAALLPLGGAPDDDEADGAPMVEGEGGAEAG